MKLSQSMAVLLCDIQDWPNGYHEAWKPKTAVKLEALGLLEKKQVKSLQPGLTHGAWFLTAAGYEEITRIQASKPR